MKIVADEQIPGLQSYVGNQAELILCAGRAITPEILRDADVLLVRAVTRVDAALLANSSVRFVGSMTAGCDHLDTNWLDQAGIAYASTPGFNAPPVADYVVSVLAVLQRQQLFPQYGAKAAVIGVGHVGRLVAERLQSLGMRVVLCDPYRAQQENDFPHVSLDDIADVELVSLHVPLTDDGQYPTRSMINRDFMQRQKPGCVLLNASRGAVLRHDDFLNFGQHLLACLDVYENEPEIADDLLQRAFIATPHIAGYSVQAKLRGAAQLYQALCEHGFLQPSKQEIALPAQRLTYAGSMHHWQDIVMGIFNPQMMTLLLRARLAVGESAAVTFDTMRRDFNYRHEFSSTRIVADQLLPEDKKVLEGLGVVCAAAMLAEVAC